MPLTITYKHNHDCSREGRLVTHRPDSDDGVAFITIPTCEETMTELERVKVEQY
jgi:hypothetical protein